MMPSGTGFAHILFRVCASISILLLAADLFMVLMDESVFPMPEGFPEELISPVSAIGLLSSANITGNWANFWRHTAKKDGKQDSLAFLRGNYRFALLAIALQALFEGLGRDTVLMILICIGVILFCELSWRKYRKMLEREAP